MTGTDVALVTYEGLPALAPGDQLLAGALGERGLTVRAVVWDDPGVVWDDHAIVVVRSTWDYVDRREGFLAWAERVGETTRLENPASVLRWNTHKGYLLELEDRGAPVVPTAWLARGDEVDLAALARSRGWREVICKPAVSAGSRSTGRFDARDPRAQDHLDRVLDAGDAMVQPYLPRVEVDGELSLLFADHEPTHAVRKTPAPGDFRTQEHLGGRYVPVTAERDAVELARWVLEVTGHRLLYARVDLIRADDGAWQVAELEATEPDLYLHVEPSAADAYAEAIAGRLA